MKAAILLVLAAACSRDPAADKPHGKVELVDAPASHDARPVITAELARAQHDGKRLVVYVGATWCEPCRHFHEAAAAGQLDASFGELRLLVFDADRDADALQGAGYIWELIPVFAIPRADGMASGHQIEGSIKGGGAVEQISPRLRALLDGRL